MMKRDYPDRLRTIFSGMVSFDSNEWEQALDFFEINHWKSEEVVFQADDFPTKIYFVVEGLARYFYITVDGKEKIKSIVRVGGALSSMSTLINNESSPFYTQALTDCVTVSIEYSDLVDLADRSSNWNLLIRRLLENLALKKERREASFLLLSARQRYEQFLVEFGEEASLVPLKHVAMYLGITDVSLSRIRKEMDLT